jgi:hypothetical protein
LLVRPAFDVAQDERRAKVERQRAHAIEQVRLRLSFFACHVGRRWVRGRRAVLVLEHFEQLFVDRLRLDPAPARPLQRLVHCDPVQPGEGSGIATEAVEVSPDLDERVLRCFLDVPLIG